MDRERILELLAQAPESLLVEWADRILAEAAPFKILQPPTIGLLLVQARDPVGGQVFFLGDVLVTEARVELEGQPGYGLIHGREKAKALAVAVLDAAVVAKHSIIPEMEEALIKLEETQAEERRRRWQAVARTRVHFEEMGA